MKRFIGVLLGLMLLLALLAAGLVLFLGASERGTRVLAAQAERLLPLEIVDISGTLWGELQARRVSLTLDAMSIEIRNLVVAVHLWPLVFDNQLHFDRAKAEAVIYTPLGPAEPSGPAAALELPSLPVNIHVDQLQLARLQMAELEITDISGSAVWTNERLNIGFLDFTVAGVTLALSGRMESGTNPVLSTEFLWSYPAADLEGSGSLAGAANRLQIDHRLEGEYQGEIHGRLDLSRPAQPGFDLAVNAEPLSIGAVRLIALEGTVQGTLSRLEVAAHTRLEVPGLEPFSASAELAGPVMGPVDLSVEGQPLSGNLEGSGRLSWEDGVDLLLSGHAVGLHIPPLVDGVTGEAGGAFELAYHEEKLVLAVSDLDGHFNERPVEGAFRLENGDDGWRVAPFSLRVGDNQLAGDLTLGEKGLALSANIDAPELAALDLGLSGDLRASVTAMGSWPALEGRVAFQSSQLAGFGMSGERLAGSARMTDGRFEATTVVNRFTSGGLALEEVRADAAGEPHAFEWALDWRDGRLDGQYARDAESHVVTAASVDVRALDQNWSTREPVRLTYRDGDVELSPLCLTAEQSEACLARFSYREGSVSTAGRLRNLPLAVATPWVSLPIRDDAYLEGSWQIDGASGVWKGSLDLAARSLFLLLPDVEEAAVDLPDLTLTGTLSGTAMAVNLVAVDPGFSVTGSATVTPASAEGALDGRIELAVTDLSALRAFDYRVESIAGELKGGVEVSGTVLDPRFEGLVEIVGAELRLNDPDLVVEDLDAQLAIDDSGTFDFRARATHERADLTVQAKGSGLFDGGLSLQGSLVGNDLKARHPDWEVTLSPDLDFRYADGAARLSGRVVIPAADVRIKTLPSSVPRPSDDVVVKGRANDERRSAGFLTIDVELVLGDDVMLSAAGVEAKLTGTLRARLDERGRTSVRGKLDVSGGIVAAQGQTLTLESGSIVYNGPIMNPYLDVRAVRFIEDRTPTVKVGLHIRGNANKLVTSVFSDPPMAEARALSFLILGRDIEEGSTGDSNQVLAAAINLGLSQAGSITSEVMRLTGLDELSAMAETQNSFAIVAGKRVTEDVYVRYTYDTLTAMSALMVRYSLTDRWHLEARSSEYSSMDLMYSFEQ